jgi:hypothetical protein
MFCRERAARFDSQRADFEHRGARLVFIGNGTAPWARDFATRFRVHSPVYTDPSRRAFAMAGLKRSFGLGAMSIGRAKRAMAAGYSQGKTRGDPWQQGGILVIEHGEVLFQHTDQDAGEDVGPADALGVLDDR